VCLSRRLYTHRAIEESGFFAVNILGAHQLDVGLRFAGMKPDVTDRFSGVPVATGETGAPLLEGSLASIDCRLWNRYDGGDHSIFVGEVRGVRLSTQESPLLYHDRLWRRTESITSPSVPLAVQLIEDAAEDEATWFRVRAAFGEAGETFDPRETVRRVRDLQKAGASEVTLVDSTSCANPQSVRKLVQEILPFLQPVPLSLELSDARGMGLANLLSALKSGVSRFLTSDTPRPQNPNPVSTASALAMLTEMGIETRVVRMGVRSDTDPDFESGEAGGPSGELRSPPSR
jgi:hypothetical protein